MKKFLAVLLLALCASLIVSVFWRQELKYSLPTPIPAGYKTVATGSTIDLGFIKIPDQALFIHFYNPDCPCSRFNARHLKSLIRSYSDSVEIVVIVPNKRDIKKARREFGEAIRYVSDEGRQIAKSCGVYSTPQAVIIDQNRRLFFRGNYNKTRYCTQKATNFAELALIAMLNHQRPPAFGLLASTSYGCEFPSNEEKELF